MISRSICVAVAAIALIGCDVLAPAKLDTSSEAAFKESYFKATKNLSSAQNDQLKQALFKVALKESGADFDLTSSESSSNPFASLAKAMVGSAGAAVTNDQDALAKMVVMQAADVIGGKTPEQVIKYAAGEVGDPKQDEVRRLKKQTVRLDKNISETEQELIELEKSLVPKREKLSRITTAGARYYWNKGQYGFDDKPVIAFKIKNGADIPVKRIFMSGILETPGRSIPWLKEDFNYEFKGGLEPNESQSLSLLPNKFGKWGGSELRALSDAMLTVSVEDVELADGSSLMGRDEVSKAQELRKRFESLRSSKEKLTKKIDDLERAPSSRQ